MLVRLKKNRKKKLIFFLYHISRHLTLDMSHLMRLRFRFSLFAFWKIELWNIKFSEFWDLATINLLPRVFGLARPQHTTQTVDSCQLDRGMVGQRGRRSGGGGGGARRDGGHGDGSCRVVLVGAGSTSWMQGSSMLQGDFLGPCFFFPTRLTLGPFFSLPTRLALSPFFSLPTRLALGPFFVIIILQFCHCHYGPSSQLLLGRHIDTQLPHNHYFHSLFTNTHTHTHTHKRFCITPTVTFASNIPYYIKLRVHHP